MAWEKADDALPFALCPFPATTTLQLPSPPFITACRSSLGFPTPLLLLKPTESQELMEQPVCRGFHGEKKVSMVNIAAQPVADSHSYSSLLSASTAHPSPALTRTRCAYKGKPCAEHEHQHGPAGSAF
ncbi:hypothetical protein VNI00_016956 [Paramarasmius palmivorus]|uniref:Uncharacterized protein n=1 Tax=Paramarasmius palmivorus TaxID=297713 RepID=A0AAW0B9A7_9AGAR